MTVMSNDRNSGQQEKADKYLFLISTILSILSTMGVFVVGFVDVVFVLRKFPAVAGIDLYDPESLLLFNCDPLAIWIVITIISAVFAIVLVGRVCRERSKKGLPELKSGWIVFLGAFFCVAAFVILFDTYILLMLLLCGFSNLYYGIALVGILIVPLILSVVIYSTFQSHNASNTLAALGIVLTVLTLYISCLLSLLSAT